METRIPDPTPVTAVDEERLARAKRRLAALKGFYTHLFIFILVMACLAIINAAVGGPWWVLWVLLGWGLGVIAHGLTVFGQTSRRIADWEERKLKELLDSDQ
ncbi:MAG TPA: 2TM domain-containing protein [Hyphomicrobiaceae bacterium]|nr:2TM domain-containing protein [Hyphomicrobiaceae bacterium]